MLLLKNARVVDANTDEKLDILIENGKIKKVEKEINLENVKVIDLSEYTVMPAFVEMHAHFRDPGFTYKEDLYTGSLAALRGGYTTVNMMANTNPIVSTPEVYEDIMKRGRELDLIDLFQVVSVTENFDGVNLVDYSKFDTPTLSDDGKGITTSYVLYEALKKAKEHNKLILIHAEDANISKIDYRLGEDLETIRDIEIAKALNTRLHFCHVSTVGSIEAIERAKKEGYPITCEVAPHHISLYDLEYKVHPPIRKKVDVDRLIKAIKDGVVDTIATDHAPHSPEDKAKGAPGMVGLESAFCISYTVLVKENGLDIKRLSSLMSKFGAETLGVNKGLIKEGYNADLVVVDLDKKVKIEAEKLVSKSKNTPFDQKEFYGEIKATFKDGIIKYGEDNL
ncbi:dihydroorotase [Streptobacillus felis]|nr:dihydroorotase [Streptobacillus felis]